MLKHKKIYLIPVLSFIFLIILFAVLLLLPISNKINISIFDGIFLSTSAITGTGFSTINVANDLTVIGKIFLLLGIQIGALGFMMLFSFIILLNNKKLKFSDFIIVGNEINTDNYSKIKETISKILKYTFKIEFMGAMLLSIFFVPKYGVIKGIGYGVFHSISAFCNAGFDTIGFNSLNDFSDNLPINLIMIFLMICGSIGYFVLDDISNCIKNRTKHLSVYSNIIIKTSIVILLFSCIVLKLLNPNITILHSLFLSVSCRSTGFSTFDLSTITRSSKIILVLLMFIGGASGSTAGGIKISNFFILLLLPIVTIKNEDIIIGYRRIDSQIIKKSLTITITYTFFVIIAFILMTVFDTISSDDLLFELVSAFTNTGIGTVDLNTLSYLSKIIMIIYMYIGRLGPITLLTLFSIKGKNQNNSITYPTMDIML